MNCPPTEEWAGYGNGYGCYGDSYGYDNGDGYGGDSYGYDNGDGYGYGYGYGYGNGNGNGNGNGCGNGDGYGNGDGDGYGYGYGSGNGYGCGYGYGDGYGDGDSAAQNSLAWYHLKRATARKGWTLALYKSDVDGEPANGGRGTVAAVGAIHHARSAELCVEGLHATLLPAAWRGTRTWLVELKNPIQGTAKKMVSTSRRILQEI